MVRSHLSSAGNPVTIPTAVLLIISRSGARSSPRWLNGHLVRVERVERVEQERRGRGRGLRWSAADGAGLSKPSESSAPLRAPVLYSHRRPRFVEKISPFRDRLRGGGQSEANSRLLSCWLTGGCDWHFLLGDFLRFFFSLYFFSFSFPLSKTKLVVTVQKHTIYESLAAEKSRGPSCWAVHADALSQPALILTAPNVSKLLPLSLYL